MNFTKPMIEAVFQIRKSAPNDIRPKVKFANPQLFDDLIAYYHTSADNQSRILIRNLFDMAGSDSRRSLEEYKRVQIKSQTRTYRGAKTTQTQNPAQTKAPSVSPSQYSQQKSHDNNLDISTTETTPSKSVRIYRGRRIPENV